MKTPNVITAAEVAREKACTTQAIYNALDRGDLNEVRMGGIRLILKDAAYDWRQLLFRSTTRVTFPVSHYLALSVAFHKGLVYNTLNESLL